jgi:hypothetical protein
MTTVHLIELGILVFVAGVVVGYASCCIHIVSYIRRKRKKWLREER